MAPLTESPQEPGTAPEPDSFPYTADELRTYGGGIGRARVLLNSIALWLESARPAERRALLAAKQPEPPTAGPMREPVAWHEKRWREYERDYILPCFQIAEEIGFDLEAAVAEAKGNCVMRLIQELRRRAALAAVPQPSPEGGEAAREAYLRDTFKEALRRYCGITAGGIDEAFDFFRIATGPQGVLTEEDKRWGLETARAALSRKETPHG